jgi:hypothetical protein
MSSSLLTLATPLKLPEAFDVFLCSAWEQALNYTSPRTLIVVLVNLEVLSVWLVLPGDLVTFLNIVEVIPLVRG